MLKQHSELKQVSMNCLIYIYENGKEQIVQDFLIKKN